MRGRVTNHTSHISWFDEDVLLQPPPPFPLLSARVECEKQVRLGLPFTLWQILVGGEEQTWEGRANEKVQYSTVCRVTLGGGTGEAAGGRGAACPLESSIP